MLRTRLVVRQDIARPTDWGWAVVEIAETDPPTYYEGEREERLIAIKAIFYGRGARAKAMEYTKRSKES